VQQAGPVTAPVGREVASRLEEAIGYFRAALALRSDSPGVYRQLGSALRGKGDLEGAIAYYEAALRLEPNYARVHQSLGVTLDWSKDPEGAVREYRAALDINPNLWISHNNLGYRLYVQQHREEGLREFQAAVALNPTYTEAHANLGVALHDKRDLEGALREFEAVVALQPDEADAHGNLGALLCERGDWGSAVREYAEAFAVELNLAGHPSPGKRREAAAVAALAGCGQSQAALAVEHAHHPGVIKDAREVGDQERDGLRNSARDWLRADLERWRRLLEQGPDTTRQVVAEQMGQWQWDPDLAGVRGEQALAGLPEAERAEWRKLWREVEALRQRAARPPDKAAAPRP
jgi:tetratricopeptide (TPR) repeat protein